MLSIFKCFFYLHFRDDLVFDSLFGLVIVVLSLLGFISLVWLKDQLSSEESPQWLLSDREFAKAHEEEEQKHRLELREEAARAAVSLSRSKQNSHDRQVLDSDLKHLEAQLDVSMHRTHHQSITST